MKKIYSGLFMLVLAVQLFGQNNIDNSFFDKVNYRGAFGTQDWTQGWANYDPQNTVYPAASMTVPASTLTTSTTWGESVVVGKQSFTNSRLQDVFFEQVNYIGAFGETDWTENWANFDPQNTVYGSTTVTVAAQTLAANTNWTASNIYLLDGFIYVPADVTLTIEAGTLIRGDKTHKGTIIVEKGGKLIAKGTKLKPIVFTSNQAIGTRAAGDWGGIILLGKSKINPSGGTSTIEGGVGRSYGGDVLDDNSGSLEYVRLEYPGVAFEPNNEINGLTMGGVGSGTSINYVQVSFSGDDSFEWFGGTVNAKHLIAYQGLDDDFDTDYGYVGKVQFAVALRNPNVADEAGDSNGFESDNDGTGSTAEPFTGATFSNFSMYGPAPTVTSTVSGFHKRGIYIRRNSRLSVYNSVFSGWVIGMQIKDATTQAAATANNLQIENCLIAGSKTKFFDSSFERTYFMDAARNNDTLATADALNAIDPFNLTGKPNFLYNPGFTYLLNGFVFVPSGITLTIKPGTIIRGDKTNKGTIIVEMGGKINAEGTVENPIVFTSNQAIGSRASGDWGGIILLGKSQINPTGGVSTIEGGVGRTYGGGASPILTDNSGVLKYVRIEYPGVAFEPNNEINGLTMGGVGSGTTIDYVQVSGSGDDSFEWFGGTVNAKHLIAYKGLDDDFDTDYGFQGMVQYAVAVRNPNIADEAGDSNGFESDNDGTGSAAEPFTKAIFSNVSFFGPKETLNTTASGFHKRGIYIRRNSRLSIYNSIIAGSVIGMQLKDATTQAAATANTLKIENTVIAGASSKFFEASFDRTYFTVANRHNDTLATNDLLMITDPYNATAPNFLPKTGSPMLTGSYWNIPAADINFVVNDGTTAIVGATITIGATTQTTNAEGKATFAAMEEGSYEYAVTATSYESKTGNVSISGVDVTETVSLVYIIPNADITFEVVDGTNAIAGAIVTIGATSKTTDATGKVTFEQLAPNTYAYVVEAADYKTKTGSVVLNGVNVTETVSLTKNEADKYTVLFAVRNSKTQLPVEAADVTLNEITVATDMNGFAAFDALTTGKYDYQVSKEDFEQVSSTVEVNDKDVVVNVLFKYLKYHIKFIVKDKDAETPVAGAEITIGSKTLTTDALGMATTEDLTAGTYSYTITKTDFETINSTIELIDNDVEVNVEFIYTDVTENANQAISIYPNPVSNELFIDASQEISELVVFDVTGQVVMKIVNQNRVDVSSLEKGLYFISISTIDGKVNSQRIVKQ